MSLIEVLANPLDSNRVRAFESISARRSWDFDFKTGSVTSAKLALPLFVR